MKYILENKKKITIVLVVLSIFLVGFSVIRSAYGLYYKEEAAPNANNFSTGLLAIEAKSKSDTISLDNAIPMTDADGAETNPYVFTITNTGNLDYTFDVRLLSTSSNAISPGYIKLKIDNDSVTSLSSLTNSTIKSNVTLAAKESMDISIRIWLDINTPNSQIGKEFTSNLVIDGIAVYTETNYDPYSGAAATIRDLFDPNSTVTNNSIIYQIDTTNNLIKDTMGNIRYYGANPNNYIYFNCDTYPSTNCETWRIIGLVDNKVKLIRGSSIGNYSWDTSSAAENSGYGINQWAPSIYTTDNSTYYGADLMKLLNPGYENNQDLGSAGTTITVNNSLYYNSGSGTCYASRYNYSNVTCDFTSTGIKNDATRNKMAGTTYYTGGLNTNTIYPNVILEKERGTTVVVPGETCTGDYCNDDIIRTTTWKGKIALPYASDYGYAVDLSLCTGKTLNQYNDSTCTANNWMRNIITNNGSNSGWLLSPNSNDSLGEWRVLQDGSFNSSASSYNFVVVPVLYLSSDEVFESGTGTSADPYKLAA